MIDSHCHLDCDAFDADRDAVLERARIAGVEAIVVPAVDERTWGPIVELSRRSGSPRCHAALGIHPVALPSMDAAEDDEVLDRLAAALEVHSVVAVGECGLDATIDLTLASMARQERVLQRQLLLAAERYLPVVLHARGSSAYERMLPMLLALPPGWRGVIHSYSGGVDVLKRFLPLPVCFGFAGPATYANARKIRATVQGVPDDRLLAETDAPDQTPEPHRPGRSEPAYVADVIRGLAAARGVTEEEVRALTSTNARRLFGLATQVDGKRSPPAEALTPR